MQKILLTFLLFLCAGLFSGLFSQEYLDRINQLEEGTPLIEIQRLADEYFRDRDQGRGSGYKQYKRWEYKIQDRLDDQGRIINYNSLLWEASKQLRGAEMAPGCNADWSILGPTDDYVNGPSGYNPGLGRVNVVAFHPSDPDIIFVGTPSGGLWKTTNEGSSWFPLTDKLPSIGVSGIVIHPTDPNIIYILTGDGDGGDTFSIGVLKSTNGGITWNDTGLSWGVSSMVRGYKLVRDPSDPDVLLAATTAGLYRTTDAGANWTQEQSGTFVDIEYKPNDPATIYASTGSQFYRSTDSGANWTLISTGLPTGESRVALAVSPDDPEYVYYLAGPTMDTSVFRGLYRSTNGGTSFDLRINTPNILDGTLNGDGFRDQSTYDLAMAVAPGNAERVITGGINVWGSNDGGATVSIIAHWNTNTQTSNNLQYTHADIHELVYNPLDGSLWCGSDGGVFRSLDNGVTWDDRSSVGASNGLAIMQFYRIADLPSNANFLIGGTQDNGSDIWSGGNDVTHIDGADGMDCMIDFNTPSILYHSRQNGGLRKSLDGGNTHSSIRPGQSNGSWVTPYAMDPADPTIIYAAYVDTVYRSTNGGSTWSGSIPSLGAGAYRSLHVAPANASVVYAATASRMFVSTNSASTWTEITAGLPVGSANITMIATDVTNSNDVWVTFSGFSNGNKVFYSSNGGSTWQNWSGSLPNAPANCIVYDDTEAGGDNAVYVGMDVGVFYRDATMTDWLPFFDGLPNMPVFDLEVHVPAGKLRAGTYGRGLWETALFVPDNTPPDVTCPADISVSSEPGLCSAHVWYTASATDDCTEDPEISFSIASGSVFPVGTTEVTVTATDVSGNEASCSFDVTVMDLEPPVAMCQGIAVYPDENGDYHIDADAINNGSTDNCGIASVTVSPDFIPCFHEAYIQTVTLTVMDIHGNSSQCDALVTLLDDDDCDGVGNTCDLCPGGDDQVDANGDGLPDCKYFPGMDYLIDEWKCGNITQKVFMCHFYGKEGEFFNTICVSQYAVPAHLDHGDYVGPCGNASCGDNAPLVAGTAGTGFDFLLFPNPAKDEVYLGLEQFIGRPVTLRVLNALGQSVLEIRIPEVQTDLEVLDLSQLGSGWYQVELRSEEIRVARKFVLAR